MRKIVVAVVVAAIVAAYAGSAAGGGAEWRGSAPYSVPLSAMDAALDCRSGMEALDGAEHDEPVLLVHGTGVTRSQNWGSSYWPALDEAGFEECWVALPDAALNDAQISAEYVARAVEVMHEATGEKIDIIGHSQGGLLPRWAIKYFSAGAFVDDYVGIASPNHGTAMTELSADRQGRCFESCWQMRRDSTFLSALNGGDETPGPISYTSIYTSNDELVRPPDSSVLDGGTNIRIQDLCPARPVEHLLMAFDAVTWAHAIDALTHEGAAHPARVGRTWCLRLAMPGASPHPSIPADWSNARYPDHSAHALRRLNLQSLKSGVPSTVVEAWA